MRTTGRTDYRHLGSRVYIAARQRGTDATAWGLLLTHVPGLAASFAVVSALSVSLAGGGVGWLLVGAWLLSGGLAFHRPTERFFARRVLKLRLPETTEQARLEPIWHEVTARAGIEPGTYELLVENSDDLNAVAVAGHVVGVTTYALNEVPSSHLAAVLAHELGASHRRPLLGGPAGVLVLAPRPGGFHAPGAGRLLAHHALPAHRPPTSWPSPRAGANSAPTDRPSLSASPVRWRMCCCTCRLRKRLGGPASRRRRKPGGTSPTRSTRPGPWPVSCPATPATRNGWTR